MTYRSQSATAEEQRMEEQRARIVAAQRIGAKRANDQASGLFADDYDANEITGEYDARAILKRYRMRTDACHAQAGDFAPMVGMYSSPAGNATANAGMNAVESIIGALPQGAAGNAPKLSKPAPTGIAKRVTITIEIEGFPS